MQKHYKRPFKCIVLVRDLMDVLASYMQWYTENPDSFINRFNLKNDDEKLSMIMNTKGTIAKELDEDLKKDNQLQQAVSLLSGWEVMKKMFKNLKIQEPDPDSRISMK